MTCWQLTNQQDPKFLTVEDHARPIGMCVSPPPIAKSQSSLKHQLAVLQKDHGAIRNLPHPGIVNPPHGGTSLPNTSQDSATIC